MPYFPKPGVADCSETPPLEEEAIILFPSLGTPLLLAPGQTTASIFIAAPSGMRGKAKGNMLMEKAVDIYKLVDQHLRVVDIQSKNEDKEPEGSTTRGTLFGEDKECALARQHINGWRVGGFVSGAVIHDRHKRPFATIAAPAAQLYPRMRDVYEIELDLTAPAFSKLKNPDSLVSLAWIVRLSVDDKKLKGFEKLQYAEAQDIAIARFLERQVAGDPYHFNKLYEFKLHEPGAKFDKDLPVQSSGLDARLKSWHPVKRMAVKQLKIGHLSDVHVNARHNALAASKAKVLEDESQADWNQPVGTKVCNSFEALKSLFEKMAAGEDKADVVLLTGDLIDFNRNFNPQAGATNIGQQWKDFNLLANIFDKKNGPRLYPRGMDDMLVFSLVREMYRKYKLPIIMTSGNHEAYQVPYGISARVEAGDLDNWAFKLGVLESTTVNNRAARQRFEENAKQSWPDGRLPNAARRGQKAVAQPDAVERHRAELEVASAWTRGKANEGMSRDHNLTVYEACLAYGPTYGQALTGYNFSGDQFDWFYALFTPLADCVVAYGADSNDQYSKGTTQVIAALGWGYDENFKNLLGIFKSGVDRQGAGILPRAVESISDSQMKLLHQARAYKAASTSKATFTVASHFTIVSFDEPEPYSNVAKAVGRTSFMPNDSVNGLPGMRAAFNHVNVGTCERNQASYLKQFVQCHGSKYSQPMVDWHLSGHSHRSGVYKVQWKQTSGARVMAQMLHVVSAKDPGIHDPQTLPPHGETALIVSSCGGPIGYQNLDGELSAWTGRPPAGSLLDPVSGLLKQIKTDRCHLDGTHKGNGFNEKPRLAVALDYLHVMHGLPDKGNIQMPLAFKVAPQLGTNDVRIDLLLSEQFKKLRCVLSVTLWVFEGGIDEFNRPKQPKWHRLTTNLDQPGAPTLLTLPRANVHLLSGAFASGVPVASGVPGTALGNSRRVQAAFCEVGLKTPENMAKNEDWAKDMQCSDPWVFPVQVFSADGRRVSRIERPVGEFGEAPDWSWLYKTWGKAATGLGNKYPEPLEIIRPTI